MAERKPFLLRVNPELLDALQKWAGDELRSVNGQIRFPVARQLDAPAGCQGRRQAPSTDRNIQNGEHDEP